MNNFNQTIFVSFLILFSITTADVPQTINYQGILSNSDGTIAADGNYNVTFAIYDAETEGSQLWSETHEGISVTGGLFNVILGSTNPLAIAFDVPYWLSVSIGESESSSRIQMAATPYSLNSRAVNGNQGIPVVQIVLYAVHSRFSKSTGNTQLISKLLGSHKIFRSFLGYCLRS